MSKQLDQVPPKEDTLLRDSLAAERTALANERTFLAYVRTALSLVIAGTFLVKFVDNATAAILGWGLMPAGALLFLFGAHRFRQVRNRLKQDASRKPKQ